MSSSASSLSLYRSMVREAKRIVDYNFREYALRRVRVGFEQGRSLAGREELSAALKEAEEGMGIIRRTAVMGGLYPHSRSVMENVDSSATKTG